MPYGPTVDGFVDGCLERLPNCGEGAKTLLKATYFIAALDAEIVLQYRDMHENAVYLVLLDGWRSRVAHSAGPHLVRMAVFAILKSSARARSGAMDAKSPKSMSAVLTVFSASIAASQSSYRTWALSAVRLSVRRFAIV